MKKHKTFIVDTRHYPTLQMLGNHAAAVWRAVYEYADTGERTIFSGGPLGLAESMNLLAGAMYDDIDLDRSTFRNKIDERNKNAVDGVVFENSIVRGVNFLVELTRGEYDELVKGWGKRTVDHYILFVDRAAQKTNNKNGWNNWYEVISAAMDGQWDADFVHDEGA